MMIRPATFDDAPQMTSLLNEIIAIGGTTAYQTPLNEDQMRQKYIAHDDLLCCHVAEIDDAVMGFQWLRWADQTVDDLPKGWAIIASFVNGRAAGKGIGKRLFAATVTVAQRAGVKTIDATIRADNTSGLRYYSSIGFVDYDLLTNVSLSDDLVVDKARKRFEIG
ncbi:GNAT family N-acetyltransferase [Roseobacter sp. CCS2]|uniref:GNAT family N-acetyltransferase n=1 Tax=Roseobacter sp. CCS2 TaxID=391593 RepID=UPI0000F403FC|nr:GNAT family N-acetyltransferase [Roseobacter sp. CCS2]EBA14213.1 acetyltransferase, GNAT family protein [Roseobacter sp. CCS2]